MKLMMSLAAITLLIVSAFTACVLQADREIIVEYVYPNAQRTDLTIRYRVPPPPAGKVYVLWMLNLEDGKRAKGGQVQPSSGIRTVKTSADFRVTGVVVSIESSADASQMSNTWALRSGLVTDDGG